MSEEAESEREEIYAQIRAEARERAKDFAIPRIAPYPLCAVDARFLEASIDAPRRFFSINRKVLTTGTVSYQYIHDDIVLIGFELRAIATDMTFIIIHPSPLLQSEGMDISPLLGGALLFAETIIDALDKQYTEAKKLLADQRPYTHTQHAISSPLYTVNKKEEDAITQIIHIKRGADESELTKWVREELIHKKRPHKEVQDAFLVKTKVDLSDPKKKKAGRDHFNKIITRIRERTT